ncbi:MAG: hypothetical protein WA981_07930 [Glaciecola sp.]
MSNTIIHIDSPIIKLDTIKELSERFGPKKQENISWTSLIILTIGIQISVNFADDIGQYVPNNMAVIFLIGFGSYCIYRIYKSIRQAKKRGKLIICGYKELNEYVAKDFTIPLHESTQKHLHSNTNEMVQAYLLTVEKHRDLVSFDAVVIDYYLASLNQS